METKLRALTGLAFNVDGTFLHYDLFAAWCELFRYLFTVISPPDATVLMNIHIKFYGKPMGVSSNVNMFVVCAESVVRIHALADDTQLYVHRHRDEITSAARLLEHCITDVTYIHTYFISNTAAQNNTYNTSLGGRQGYVTTAPILSPSLRKKDKHYINRSKNTTARL